MIKGNFYSYFFLALSLSTNGICQNLNTTKINNQVWMSHNLDVFTFRNGDSIFFAKNKEEWILAGREGIPAYHYSNFDNSNNSKGNILYNYFAVKDKRGLAPSGWRIPNLKDFFHIRDENKKENGLIRFLNKNKIKNEIIWGWWVSDYAEEDELGRGILGMGGYIIHCDGGFLHTNEKYFPEKGFSILCIKE